MSLLPGVYQVWMILAEAGIYGAIIGKAYYEGKIDIRDAVKRFG